MMTNSFSAVFLSRPDNPAHLGSWLEDVILDGHVGQLVDELTVMQSFLVDRENEVAQDMHDEKLKVVLSSGFPASEPNLAQWAINNPELLIRLERQIMSFGSKYWDRRLTERLMADPKLKLRVPKSTSPTSAANGTFGSYLAVCASGAALLVIAVSLYLTRITPELTFAQITDGLKCLALQSDNQGTETQQTHPLEITGRSHGFVYLICQGDRDLYVKRTVDLSTTSTAYVRGSLPRVCIWTESEIDKEHLKQIVNSSLSGEEVNEQQLRNLMQAIAKAIETQAFVFPLTRQVTN